LPIAFQLLETLAIGLQPSGAEKALESARVDRLVQQAVKILFVIAARTGDAFGVERLKELVAGQPAEMLRVVSEGIEMPDRPAVFRQPRRLDAGNLLEVGAQVVRVLTSARGFMHQLVELLHENHGLELLHPIVAATGKVRLCTLEGPGGASNVVERVAPVQEIIAVASDGADRKSTRLNSSHQII